MESLRPQPDHNIEVQRFLKFLRKEQSESPNEKPLTCAHFVPKSSLQQYFERERGSLERLLHAIIDREEFIPAAEVVRDKYLSILAILVEIGYGAFLTRFVEQDYSDQRLPFDEQPKYFPITPNQSFFDLFAERQWPFCPQPFEKLMENKQMRPKRVLPIISKQLLKESAPATIYRVEIHEEYDQLRDNPDTPQGVLDDSKHRRHTYIFKEFTGAYGRDAYDKERMAFKYLKTTQQLGKTIIGYYGSFSLNDTHTLMLEYADRGTLDDFLRTVEAPSTGAEIMKLWESLLKIQNALYTIHEIPTDGLEYTNETKQFSALRGWHSDLKPANILVVSGNTDCPFDCEFRLADLGTSNFARLAALKYDIRTAGEGATRQYGAPECYQGDYPGHSPLIHPQKADIWSLGCVYSEFAIWVVRGQTGLVQYKEDRKQETRKGAMKDIGCFHDGEKALKCVKKWIDDAFDNKRSSDHVTKSVLRKLVDEMLYPEADARPTAKQLTIKAKDIFETARNLRANSARRGSATSDSTGRLTQQLRTGKQRRQPHEPGDVESSDESDAAAPAVSSPSRQLAHLKVGAVQSPIPLDTTLLGRHAFGTPYQADVDEGTRNSSPGSTFPRAKKQPSPASMHRGSSQKNDVRYALHFLESPSERAPHTRFPDRKERYREDLPNRFIDSTVMQGSHTEAVGPVLEADEHHIILDVTIPAQLVESPPLLPDPVLPLPEAPKPMAQKPSLSLERGLIYYSDRKAGRSLSLNDGGCLKTLADPERDFVFLVDDSASMRSHRNSVYETVQFLAWLLKGYDKDGIDMYFMKEKGKHHARARSSSDLLPHVKQTMKACQGTSDVSFRLGTILHDYRDSWVQSLHSKRFSLSGFLNSSKIKPLSIYVLTDGEWELGSDPSRLICDTAMFLEQQGAPASQLGIQFIRFGDRPENRAKLEHLDSGLDARRDMVDTEPVSGNVFKMLLGPISRLWDDY